MNTSTILHKMRALRLGNMADNLEVMLKQPNNLDEATLEAVDFLLDCEKVGRDETKRTNQIKKANVQYKLAHPDNVLYSGYRELNKSALQGLFRGHWFKNQNNIVLEGSQRCGKTYIASALAVSALMANQTVYFWDFDSFLEELNLASIGHPEAKLHDKLYKPDVVVIDDWCYRIVTPLIADMMVATLDNLLGSTSLILASVVPQQEWIQSLSIKKKHTAVLEKFANRSHHLTLYPPSSAGPIGHPGSA
ncbi:ATP-binding protein [Alteromonas sp. OM2203]|uniref:ATP-binding protein n=1 Tax=Alteromonas sp. OM2203 TaxID=3398817 RepID=UPI003AF3AFE0